MSLKVWTMQNPSGSWDAGVSYTMFNGETAVEAQYHGFTEYAHDAEVDALMRVADHLEALSQDAKWRIVQLGGEY